MKLRQPETFCIFNHDHCRIRHINSHFNNCCWNKHLDFIFSKCIHHFIFLFFLHLSMQKADIDWISQRFWKHLAIIDNIFRFHCFTFFNHWTDHIALTSLCHLFSYEFIGLRTISCIHNTVFDRKTVLRELIDHRNIQITIKNNSKCSRNRCRTHYENVWQVSFTCKHFSLFYAKTMLFIRHHKCQIVIDCFLLDQCVCSYNNWWFPTLNPGISFSLFFCFHRSGQKFCPQWDLILFQHVFDIFKMLSCKYLCRCH